MMMSEGLKLKFKPGGVEFDLGSKVTGMDCTVQNALVNIGTSVDVDSVYPDKGTGLLMAAVRGALVNTQNAAHQSNFAALDTKEFINKFSRATGDEVLSRIRLLPATFDGNHLILQCSLEFAGGKIVGAKNINI